MLEFMKAYRGRRKVFSKYGTPAAMTLPELASVIALKYKATVTSQQPNSGGSCPASNPIVEVPLSVNPKDNPIGQESPAELMFSKSVS